MARATTPSRSRPRSSIATGPCSDAELTENRELVDTVEHGPAYRVGKISIGAVRDFMIADHLALGLGGLLAVNFVPGPLAPSTEVTARPA